MADPCPHAWHVAAETRDRALREIAHVTEEEIVHRRRPDYGPVGMTMFAWAFILYSGLAIGGEGADPGEAMERSWEWANT